MTYVMIEDSDGEWGISRSGSNPERDDFVLCGSRSDAERLSRWLNEEPTRLQLEALLDAIEQCRHAPRGNEPWEELCDAEEPVRQALGTPLKLDWK